MSQSFCTATDAQGNALFAGLKNKKASFGNNMGDAGDVFLKQYNRSGNLLFDKAITGKALVQTAHYNTSGDFYLAGLFNDSARFDAQHILAATASTPIPFVAKYTASGQVQWVRNMRVSNPQAKYIGAITTDAAGNLIVALNDISSHQTYIKKYDDAGTELLHIAQTNVRVASSVVTDAAGNFYVGGSCAENNALFNGVDLGTGFSYDKYLISYTATGTPRWVKFVQDNSCYASDLLIDNTGKLYWAGPLFASTSFDTITADGKSWSYDFFLTCFDTTGAIQWLREVPQINTADAGIGFKHNDTSAKCIALDNDNNVYLSGFMRNTLDWGNGISNTSAGLTDIMVQKYQPDGTLLWSKTAGSTSNDQASSVAVNLFGEVYVSGIAQGTLLLDTIQHTGPGLAYPVLAKIALAADTTVISAPVIHTKKLAIYPNPALQEVLISVDKAIRNGSVLIYNALGHVVKEQTVSGDLKEIRVDVNQLPAGMYVVQLQAGDAVYRERLVKQ